MDIGKSVRKAFDEFFNDDSDSAMLHACNAVDATAKKVHGAKMGSNLRFTTFLRQNYGILGPMAMPSLDMVNQRFNVRVERPKAPGGEPDFADVIYGIHRCSHSHGEALPDGFELLSDVNGPLGRTRMQFDSDGSGKLRLSDRVIFGLLGVVIMAPVNTTLRIPGEYYLTFGRARIVMMVNDWWGRAADFPAIAATEPVPIVNLNWPEKPQVT